MNHIVNLIFPHQLFEDSPLLYNGHDIYMIEEHLFFKQYTFHKQKIAFHRATMKFYEHFLKEKGIPIHYVEAHEGIADIRHFDQEIHQKGIVEIHIIDPTDDWLLRRIKKVTKGCKLVIHPSPLFLNTDDELTSFFREDKKSFFQTTFYKQQRKKRNILLESDGKPTGGKWTFDTENRKKYPRGKTPPFVQFPEKSTYWDEAVVYTQKYFSSNLGQVSNQRIYPITYQETATWFDQFLIHRFHEFGIYEDAIVKEYSILNHSILTPMLNVGLIKPQTIIDQALNYAKNHDIPINSTEGFVRQIIGWREFIRGMYQCKGRYSRTRNYWQFTRKIPASFYDGTTGIPPIDMTIKKILKTGYCHHIERLMILGNFMLLCEFDPDEVYRWFMELFIDSYDWVMVPNVYGMSQFSDGGTFATKPYIGGSNYLKKMSNYPKGEWEVVWDGLFWRFIDKYRDFFSKNPRSAVLLNIYNKMSEDKKSTLQNNAEQFIKNVLDKKSDK